MSPEKKERHCEKVFSILAKISVQGLRNLRNSYSTLYANSFCLHIIESLRESTKFQSREVNYYKLIV